MAEKQIKENYLDFYLQNSDWEGRTVVDSFEKVNFQKDSSIRIWYNEQNHNYDKHWHNALEIIMPVENHYDVDASDQNYHLLPGEILIIPSGEMHALYAPETGKRFIFQFDVSGISQMKGYTSIQSLMTNCLHITKLSFPQIYGDIYQILIQIRNEYFSSNEFRELAIYSHLINLFVSIGRNHINDMDLFPNTKSHKQQEYLQKFNDVLDYIDSHYTEELTLDDIADFSGFSKYHFTRLFKQYTDSTFYDYLSFRRIKSAEELLAKPELSITEIALQSGFSSISTFNRIFKQKKGCTPSEYRSLYSQNRHI